jgi:hypothetical protein
VCMHRVFMSIMFIEKTQKVGSKVIIE